MAFTLPSFQRRDKLVEEDRSPSLAFHIWWQEVLNSIKQTIANLEATDATVAETIETLEETIDDLADAVDRLTTAETDITSIETDITALEAADVALDGRVDALEAADIALDTRLDTVEADYLTEAEGNALYALQDADLSAISSSGIADPWTAYTPTVSALGGTITTATGTGWYMKIGKTVFFRAVAEITTNGTGSIAVHLTAPFPSRSSGYAQPVVGLGNDGTLSAFILDNSSTVRAFKYDNTYPGGDGKAVYVQGAYEAA